MSKLATARCPNRRDLLCLSYVVEAVFTLALSHSNFIERFPLPVSECDDWILSKDKTLCDETRHSSDRWSRIMKSDDKYSARITHGISSFK